MRTSDASIAEAKRKVTDARAMNPMFRVAAAWQRTPVETLTGEQFEQVKHWAVIALSVATALATALAAIISSLPERAAAPSKLAKALRAWLGARRKTLRRIDDQTRVEYRDRIVVRWVPIDADSGLPVNPENAPLRAAGGKP
jgi:hypothetical protein